jgi:hypothetical protein
MQLTSPPFWILPFNNRHIGVALHGIRGLVLFDPKGQRNLPSDRVRLYVADENVLYLLYSTHVATHLHLPRSEKQAWLGVLAYEAFLNPALRRPTQFDPKPTEGWYGLTETESPDDQEREVDLIRQEALEDQEAWARSEEDGWFYDD